MQRNVLFIHGGGGGAYEADKELAASLGRELGTDYSVRYPQMPDEEEADYEVWKAVIARELAAMRPAPVLAGHSIGASVVIRVLAEGKTSGLAGAFLVAAPFWHDHKVWHWPEVELPPDAAEKLKGGPPLFFYHGIDDETVPVEHMALYARVCPQATFRRLKGRNHQLNDDLSEVARDITQLGA
jgi:predicted alpha/beta hydrolase family esterase